MNRDEVGAGGAEEQRVEQRPIADRIAAVGHALGPDVWRGHAAGVEMVAGEQDRRHQPACRDLRVDRSSELRTLAMAQPAAARGQALHRDVGARELDPRADLRPFWKELAGEVVQAREIGAFAAECNPAKRADALAEKRTCVSLGEAVDGGRVRNSGRGRLHLPCKRSPQ